MNLAEKIRNQSWDQFQVKLGDRQKETLAVVRQYGDRGITAWEISQLTKRMIHTVRPRLTELLSYKLVKVIGRRYHPETDRMESVWAVNDTDPDGQRRLF